jgi:hypothetical protein
MIVRTVSAVVSYNTIRLILYNAGDFLKLDKPISVQAIVESNGTVVDGLDDETSDKHKIEIHTRQASQQFYRLH